MRIKVLEIGDIEWEKQGKAKWQSLELSYDSDQGKKSRKFVSFNDIFNVVKKLEVGQEYDVQVQKDDKGYWNWIAIEPASTEAVKMEKAVTAPGKAAQSGNTWDEKNKLDRERFEFEKEKQLLIIRQSCLSSAVEYAIQHLPDPSPQAVLSLTEEFVQYVLSGPVKKSPGRPKKVVEEESPEEVEVN